MSREIVLLSFGSYDYGRARTCTMRVRGGVVVVEWCMAVHPPGLQRRASRLPRITTGNTGDRASDDDGWIWLLQYLADPAPPQVLKPTHPLTLCSIHFQLVSTHSRLSFFAKVAGPLWLFLWFVVPVVVGNTACCCCRCCNPPHLLGRRR